MTMCCIFSAGKQTRWPNLKAPKQLSLVYGERLMDRQLKQLAAHNIPATVFAWHQDILSPKPPCPYPFTTLNLQSSPASLLHTLLASVPYWTERTLLLNGDVYVFDDFFEKLVTDPAPLRFWMNQSEIYAVTVRKDQIIRLYDAVAWCVRQTIPWEIRTVYRHLSGLPLVGHFAPVPTDLSGPFVNSCTEMFDIDFHSQLKKYPAPS